MPTRDVKLYGSAVMPDSDTETAIGGAIALTRRVEFAPLAVTGAVQAVSSDAGDTTQTVTVHYLDAARVAQSEMQTLDGVMPVAFTASMSALLKALKSVTTAGDVAVEATMVERAGTAQAGSTADALKLDAGAADADGAYVPMVLRLTAGTGAGQIRMVVEYAGATKLATVDRAFSPVPDATTQFRLSRGMVFEKLPNEVLEVRAPFYNAGADAAGGATRRFYDKVFARNEGTAGISGAQVREVLDVTGKIAFGLEAALGGSGTNGVGNTRRVAPAGVTFASTSVAVVGGSLAPGTHQGVWLELTLGAGELEQQAAYHLRVEGT
jgi:hypothetical protein